MPQDGDDVADACDAHLKCINFDKFDVLEIFQQNCKNLSQIFLVQLREHIHQNSIFHENVCVVVALRTWYAWNESQQSVVIHRMSEILQTYPLC